jgi:hypothetical protein
LGFHSGLFFLFKRLPGLVRACANQADLEAVDARDSISFASAPYALVNYYFHVLAEALSKSTHSNHKFNQLRKPTALFQVMM